MRARLLGVALCAHVYGAVDRPITPADFDSVEVWPTRPPTHKEAADSGASLSDAAAMPWFPTHEVYCANGTRLCRPGEGNLKGYRFWGQPYIHRESYVQSRRRKPPHEPDPQVEYKHLAALARRIQKDNLVIVAAADWDFRRIILNFILHAHRLGYQNALVLSMDTELHTELHRRGIPSFDDSRNLDAWNTTCLQRHVQRVRTERVLAVAALIAAGFDVLHCDATVIFVRDVLPVLHAAAASGADMIGQRHEWYWADGRTRDLLYSVGPHSRCRLTLKAPASILCRAARPAWRVPRAPA